MTATCPSAPRQARGLRGATLRRLAGNKCPRIYQTHDLRPNRCDARPLTARWHGEAMSNETTKQEVIDRILRSGNVPPGYDGDIDALLSRAYDAGRAAGRGDEIARAAVATNIATTLCGNELRAALGVTAPWDGCLATVRDLVAKDKARSAPTDAAAEDAAIDGLVGEAIRGKGVQLNAHDRSGRWRLSLGDTSIVDQREIAGAWLKGWLLAAWARGVAYGQGDISTGESRCAAQLANALGHVSETLPTWEEALAMVIPDQSPPTPGDFFGMAAREQVAAERAVDTAAVAPSDEAIAAAREEGRRAGWKEAVVAADRARIVELRAAAKADGEMLRLRNELGAIEERHGQLVLRHEVAAAILDAVTAAAPKEAP